jgi:hypothetical protein
MAHGPEGINTTSMFCVQCWGEGGAQVHMRRVRCLYGAPHGGVVECRGMEWGVGIDIL